jgi:outer membrane protein TolC
MRLADVRYKGGISTQVEILDAQTALTQASVNYVSATYDYQESLAKLERAVGGPDKLAKLTGQSTAMADVTPVITPM